MNPLSTRTSSSYGLYLGTEDETERRRLYSRCHSGEGTVYTSSPIPSYSGRQIFSQFIHWFRFETRSTKPQHLTPHVGTTELGKTNVTTLECIGSERPGGVLGPQDLNLLGNIGRLKSKTSYTTLSSPSETSGENDKVITPLRTIVHTPLVRLCDPS